MSKLKAILLRRETIISLLLVLLLFLYAMFFKPNPWIRLDLNKLRAAKSESALTIVAPEEVMGVGKKFTVKIVMDTKGNSVNAVQSYLAFDPKILEVSKTDTEQSFCKFYPENNYSNDTGLIKLSCGSPYPGFRGTNTVQEIEFYPKAIKDADIFLTGESMVLANDGKGTNLLSDLPQASIKIKASL